MTFTKPWVAFPQDPDTKVPVLDVYLRTYLRDADRRLTIPVCFADTDDAPLLLGREGSFDAFGIFFDKKNLLTRFEW